MSIADRLTAQAVHRPRFSHPKGFEPGVKLEAGQPAEVTAQLEPGAPEPKDEQEWRAEIKRVTGHDIPEHRQVELTQVRYWGPRDDPYIYCRFTIKDRDASKSTLDLEDIITAAKAVKMSSSRPSSGTDRALVVAWADLQVGKVGSRGGTEELVARVMDRLDSLEALAAQSGCDSAYLVDVGDCVESFENVPSQAFTNDLSFPEQLRVARRLYTDAALRLARLFPQVTCVGVPSNHGAWRRGKDALGRPGDDFGLEMLTSVADAFGLTTALDHVNFVLPGNWDETVALDVHGTILAVTHGHQVNRPERIPEWWAKQVHGGQPAADADILLTGHFHHLRAQPSGRSVHTGRAKWWLQAPTLDNGSDWYRLKAGDDSDPGLLTFTVDAQGWDNLKIL